MIDLHFWPTPNGHKITLFLEEANVEYRILPVDISAGEQFKPEFLRISPNNRMPAIVDHAPADGGEPVSLFESGAILLYLAEKYGQFLPSDIRGRKTVLEWLFWQVAGLGPMAGQNHHFSQYAPEKIPYAIDRYVKETNRLYGVLNGQLEGRDFIAGSYSIADMACYPWILLWERQGQVIDDFPNLKRWLATIKARPAPRRAYEKGDSYRTHPTVTEESRKILFGQTAKTVGGSVAK
ncbi:MAG: thiol:disulfide oxidoreductase [Telmatospirillum sp.]|nr:thiol:disulfide oxidoreductase [Telmatospirillum sp.]